MVGHRVLAGSSLISRFRIASGWCSPALPTKVYERSNPPGPSTFVSQLSFARDPTIDTLHSPATSLSTCSTLATISPCARESPVFCISIITVMSFVLYKAARTISLATQSERFLTILVEKEGERGNGRSRGENIFRGTACGRVRRRTLAKPAFGGPLQVLRYLGRYTHRVAISNHRLSAFEQERVTFRWKDYAHGGKQGHMTLAATEFLRRFFLHVLPKGFVRIRHFGFLTNRFRASHLALGRQLLASSGSTEQEVKRNDARSESSSLWHCPRCGASMIVIQRFTAAELSACMYFDSS
jgi:hypothetical protein